MPADYTITLGLEGTVGDVSTGAHLPSTGGVIKSVDFVFPQHASGKAMSVVMYSKAEWSHHDKDSMAPSNFAPISAWGTEYFRMITTPIRLYYISTSTVFLKSVFH